MDGWTEKCQSCFAIGIALKFYNVPTHSSVVGQVLCLLERRVQSPASPIKGSPKDLYQRSWTVDVGQSRQYLVRWNDGLTKSKGAILTKVSQTNPGVP